MATKLVTLKLDGDLEQTGFRATLEIGLEGQRPFVEVLGVLPPNLALLHSLQDWQQHYRNLNVPTRIRPQEIVYLGSIQPIEASLKRTQYLRQQMQQWMQADTFRPIDQALREELQRDDVIRLLIRALNPQIHQLPWHLWDIIDRYPNAEVGLSPLAFDRYTQSSVGTPAPTVKVLAVLGHSAGINVASDRRLLEALPHAAVTFLVEPQRQQINNQLWESPWDILFFAGHSETLETTGRIYLNPQESLSLEELKYGLRRAISQGLQLAIFNSCDGLGLAYELKELGLPYIIVMREPVPDRIAQTFLQYFLQSYAGGNSLYLAKREARERLQGLEGEFLCASWLPIIYQTSSQLPPTWDTLRRTEPQVRPAKTTYPWRITTMASLAASLLVIGVRQLGGLQPWELNAYDQLLHQRPAETLASRLVVVEVTETDINTYGFPLPDKVLGQAVETLNTYEPRVIGLDIFRDRPDKAAVLFQQLQSQENLVALCSVRQPGNDNYPGISSPPGVPETRLGFSNVLEDPDAVLRRHLLFMTPDPNDSCATRFSLSAQLALHYLAVEGIQAQTLESGQMQLGQAIFTPLESFSGPYFNLDSFGFQVLLNYTDSNQIAQRISLSALLNNRTPFKSLRDKVVLIGVTAPISNPTDYFLTPIGARQWPRKTVPGVIIQAQMVNQLITAAKDRRAVIHTWSQEGDLLWIVVWSLIGGGVILRCRRLAISSLVLGSAVLVLYGLSWGALINGLWIPIVPPALTLVLSGLTTHLIRSKQDWLKTTLRAQGRG